MDVILVREMKYVCSNNLQLRLFLLSVAAYPLYAHSSSIEFCFGLAVRLSQQFHVRAHVWPLPQTHIRILGRWQSHWMSVLCLWLDLRACVAAKTWNVSIENKKAILNMWRSPGKSKVRIALVRASCHAWNEVMAGLSTRSVASINCDSRTDSAVGWWARSTSIEYTALPEWTIWDDSDRNNEINMWDFAMQSNETVLTKNWGRPPP